MANPTGHPHVDLTETTVDLRSGLPDGTFEAQFLGPAPYVTAPVFHVGDTTAPSDVDDYRPAHYGRVLRFPVGAGSVPVWARLRPGGSAAYVARWMVNATPVNPPADQRHFDLTTAPLDVRAGLATGTYAAIVTSITVGEAVLTYAGASAPASDDDWWREGGHGARFAIPWARVRRPCGVASRPARAESTS